MSARIEDSGPVWKPDSFSYGRLKSVKTDQIYVKTDQIYVVIFLSLNYP